MGTYDHKKLLSDWATGTITNDMATGHTLQHLNLLYEVQEIANNSRQELRDEVNSLKAKVKQLEKLHKHVDRLQKTLDSLIGLNLTVYQIKDDVDSLKNRLPQAEATTRNS
jgi:predicted RNase H-like nuclease (RuvC/YqgF family)